MERLKDAFKEVLVRNAEDTERWIKYQEEQRKANVNLEIFQKKLEVEVMVPIGTKALMPGILYHTNEILVSHYRGMFSKCSMVRAQQVCKYRLKLAEESLENLEKEREMFTNKLEKPLMVGALAKEGEHEIIEAYDEEKENAWREQHSRKVRAEKFKEAEDRNKFATADKSYVDVLNVLEDLELEEEFEEELERMEIKDDVSLEKLLSGELKPPEEKKRVSFHNQRYEVAINGKEVENLPENYPDLLVNKASALNTESDSIVSFTNNISSTNPLDYEETESTSSADSSDSEIPQEAKEIEKSIENLSNKQKVSVLKTKLKDIEEEIRCVKVKSPEELELKLIKIEVRDFIFDYIEILKDKIKEYDDQGEHKLREPKIRFAPTDDVFYFDENVKNNTVLDANAFGAADKKNIIMKKVEKNREYVAENQSEIDSDLIGKILKVQKSKVKTLHIHFKHSEEKFKFPEYSNNSKINNQNVVQSPSDIYRLFGECSPSRSTSVAKNLEPNDDKLQNVLNSDVCESLLKSVEKSTDGALVTKSILKNSHYEVINSKDVGKSESSKKTRQKNSGDDNRYNQNKILGEIVGKPSIPPPSISLSEPEPLPDGEFTDSHAPKKRISRFKAMRATCTK